MHSAGVIDRWLTSLLVLLYIDPEFPNPNKYDDTLGSFETTVSKLRLVLAMTGFQGKMKSVFLMQN
jgi:hypothetical protein